MRSFRITVKPITDTERRLISDAKGVLGISRPVFYHQAIMEKVQAVLSSRGLSTKSSAPTSSNSSQISAFFFLPNENTEKEIKRMTETIVVNKTAFERMVSASTAYQSAVNEVFASMSIEQPSYKDEWINTKEAQQITGISKEKLSRMARLGECEAKRVGSDWRFPRSKVEDMSFIHVNNTAESR